MAAGWRGWRRQLVAAAANQMWRGMANGVANGGVISLKLWPSGGMAAPVAA